MTSSKSTSRRRTALALASAVLASGTVLVGSPASARTHTLSDRDASAHYGRYVDLDIAYIVMLRKVAAAQDRVDRAWLYQ
jgi:hypothetical protein